ncbi:MAG: hypothetical protein ABI946_00590 [Chthoniobacterales bacterium]
MTAVRRQRDGQVIVMLLIVLAIVGGGAWWLFHSAQARKKEAEAFARETAIRLAVYFDKKYLDSHLAPEMQTRFPPSFRDRLISNLRGLGVASSEVEIEGKVEFTDYVFLPKGQYRMTLHYPEQTAIFDLVVSCPHGWWQIDFVNLTWKVPVPPTEPLPTPVPAPRAGN